MNNTRSIMLIACLIALTGCSDSKNSAKKILTRTSCILDSVNGSVYPVVAVKRNDILKMAGWATDDVSKQVPNTVSINFVSTTGAVSKITEGNLTVARPDVNVALNLPTTAIAGFDLSAQALVSLEPGTYEIQILEDFSDRIIECKTAKSVKVN